MTIPNEPDLESCLARLAGLQPEAQSVERALQRVRAMLAARAHPPRTRSIWFRMAVAAVLLLALGGFLLPPLLRPTASAFAGVHERIEQTHSIAARQTTYVGGKAVETIAIRMLKEGMLRFDFDNGNSTVMDLKKSESLAVDVHKKQAVLIRNLAPRIPQDLYDRLLQFSAKATRRLGEHKIEGKKAVGFIVPFPVECECGKGEMTAWVDVQTRLPIRLEFVGRNDNKQEVKQVVHDIVFDRPIDPQIFAIKAPADYRVTEFGVDSQVEPAPKELKELVLTPKVGLGPVKFGMSKKEVIDALGQPDKMEREVSLNYLSRGYSLQVSPKRGVMMISCYSQATFFVKVTNFAGQTAEKIKLGASRMEIEKAYGKPDAVDNRNESTTELSYPKVGMSFVLVNDKLVEMTASRVERRKER